MKMTRPKERLARDRSRKSIILPILFLSTNRKKKVSQPIKRNC